MDILSQAGGMSLDRWSRMFAIHRLSVSAKTPSERSTVGSLFFASIHRRTYWQAPQATSAQEGKLEAGGAAGAGAGATYAGS